MSEHDALSGIRLSWPAPLQAVMQGVAQGVVRGVVLGVVQDAMPGMTAGADRAAASASRQPMSAVLPMMRGWTLPTPPSIPSLPT